MSGLRTAPREWAVALPEGKLGNVELRRLAVGNDFGNLRAALDGRGCVPGDYTGLYRNGRLWMSDTTAERRDHYVVDWEIRRRGGRILIMGLGLGMIVNRALQCDNVEHVDVVEIDPDVAELVGQHYAGRRCTIHVADAYTKRWSPGTRWSVVWHDIWPDLCTGNLTQMSQLARSYGRRTDWQGFWGKELLLRHRRHERRCGWWDQ